MYYVTANDRFLSGWGMADNKTNKIIVEVETFEEATRVYNKLKNRSEMKHVNIATKPPKYSQDKFYVSYYDVANNSDWIKERV